jgi:hypothetical protein
MLAIYHAETRRGNEPGKATVNGYFDCLERNRPGADVAKLRKYATLLQGGCSGDEGGERSEDLPDLSRMLQAVSRAHLGVAVVSHNLGKAQRAQCPPL